MNAEQLLFEYFDGVVDSPEVVPKLRNFILDLAVRGILVEQNPDDEPAVELLKRITVERSRLTELIQYRKLKPSDSIELSQVPYLVPLNWCWTQIVHLGLINPKNKAPDSMEASFVPMRLIASTYGVLSQHEKRLWGKIKKGYTHFAEGDVGLTKITPCFENGKSTVFRNLTGGVGSGTTELYILRPLIVLADYLLIFLKRQQFIETGIQKMTGTAGQKRVPLDYFAFCPFPLPPLAEQHRIVAKVDELMEQCNHLEEQFQERDRHRKQFTKASFASLTEAGLDSGAFKKRSRFVLGNFDEFSVDADQIEDLRRLILDMAVRGRLVGQNLYDEPAVNLLNDIEKERDRRIKKGEIKNKKVSTSAIKYPPFSVPENWIWVPMSVTGNIFVGSSTNQTMKENLLANENGYPYIMTKDVGYGLDPLNYENGMKVADESIDFQVAQKLTVLICAEGGSAGRKMGIADREICFGNKLIGNEMWGAISPRYLLFAYMSSYFYREFSVRMSGVIPGISMSKFLQIPFPLPPVPEQHRIVAKVDEVMGWCDLLEEKLRKTQFNRSRSLESLLTNFTFRPTLNC